MWESNGVKLRASTLSIHPDPIIPSVTCRVEIENGEGGFFNLGLWCMPLEFWLALVLSFRSCSLFEGIEYNERT